MKNAVLIYIICVYCIVAILTFGHAANNTSNLTNEGGSLVTILGGPLWPLYWSWELQRRK